MHKLLLIIVVSIMFGLFMNFMPADIKDIQYENYIVQKHDTFWAIYEERYLGKISYQEALYNFKKDNNMTRYELYEGQIIKLRVVK